MAGSIVLSHNKMHNKYGGAVNSGNHFLKQMKLIHEACLILKFKIAAFEIHSLADVLNTCINNSSPVKYVFIVPLIQNGALYIMWNGRGKWDLYNSLPLL